MQFGYEVFHPVPSDVAHFYVTVLGFALKAPDDRLDPDRDYIAVDRDGLQVGCSRSADADLSRRKPPAGCEVVLRVEDLSLEHRRVLDAGWPVEDSLQTRPWGLTDFRIFDPTGQYIRVTGVVDALAGPACTP